MLCQIAIPSRPHAVDPTAHSWSSCLAKLGHYYSRHIQASTRLESERRVSPKVAEFRCLLSGLRHRLQNLPETWVTLAGPQEEVSWKGSSDVTISGPYRQNLARPDRRFSNSPLKLFPTSTRRRRECSCAIFTRIRRLSLVTSRFILHGPL